MSVTFRQLPNLPVFCGGGGGGGLSKMRACPYFGKCGNLRTVPYVLLISGPWGPDLCESRRRAHTSQSDRCFLQMSIINILRGLPCRLEGLRLKFTNEPSIFVDWDVAESIKRSASDRPGDLVPEVRARTSPGFSRHGASRPLYMKLSSHCDIWSHSRILSMGPVRIRHVVHETTYHPALQPSHSVDRAGLQAKMASIELCKPWRNMQKSAFFFGTPKAICEIFHAPASVEAWSITLVSKRIRKRKPYLEPRRAGQSKLCPLNERRVAFHNVRAWP